MPEVVFLTHAGDRRAILAPAGESVMAVARDNGIPGIDADCGGACACATCHVYVDPAWIDRLDPRSEMEQDLLGLLDETRPTSRLSCQIILEPALDGLTVEVPAAQH